jgi:hypothetical protein
MLHAVLLLFSPGTDPFLEDLTRNAGRVFYFDGEPRAKTKLISKGYPRKQKSQATLEAFSVFSRSSIHSSAPFTFKI